MGSGDVDAHVSRGLGIVGCGAQRFSEARSAHDQDEGEHHDGGDGRSDRLPLIDEDFDPVAIQGAERPRIGSEWRGNGNRRRAEQVEAAILQNQGQAQRQDQLRVMAFGAQRAAAHAGDLADQQPVHQDAREKNDRPRNQSGHVRPDGRTEARVDAEHAEGVIGHVHAEHHEVAVGEIDHAHDAENHAQAHAHQAVDRPGEQPRDQCLQEVFSKLRHLCSDECHHKDPKLSIQNRAPRAASGTHPCGCI